MPKTVMIVTGESSGELYGALLARSLQQKVPSIRIIGIGGERMRQAGVELIAGIAGAFGLAEVLTSLKTLKQTFDTAKEALTREEPQLLVLIDYPDFNLKLAEEARKKGVKVLYYVSPQVWAWRRGRVRKIARMVDKMAVILPFEEEIYRSAGLDAEFVGHPVLDEVREMPEDRQQIRQDLGLHPERPLLALLPGSRDNELHRLLPVLVSVVHEWQKEYTDFQFCIPFAPNTDLYRHRAMIERLASAGVTVNQGEALKVLAVSDAACVASGTASLQAMLLGVPLVVIYKLFPLTYWIGRMLVKVKYISLVNILSGREVVKELLQKEASVANIMSELRLIVSDPDYRKGMLDAYGTVSRMFEGRRASDRVSDLVIHMAGWSAA